MCLKIPFIVANDPSEIENAEKLILPGVGAFDETVSILDRSGFRQILDEKVLQERVPILGICVGMQILAKRSEEGNLSGLGWINGEVKKIDKSLLFQKPKIPHLGWNSVEVMRENMLFEGIDNAEGFYFLHSYYFDCFNEADILAKTFYGRDFASSINNQNVYGVQFHPEKSHHNGIQLLQNFAKL